MLTYGQKTSWDETVLKKHIHEILLSLSALLPVILLIVSASFQKNTLKIEYNALHIECNQAQFCFLFLLQRNAQNKKYAFSLKSACSC